MPGGDIQRRLTLAATNFSCNPFKLIINVFYPIFDILELFLQDLEFWFDVGRCCFAVCMLLDLVEYPVDHDLSDHP